MADEPFALPAELEEFRALVREIVEEKIGLARAAEIDDEDEFPWDVHKIFVEHELMGVGYPEEFGGHGGGSLTFAVLIEEISRISAGCSLMVLVSRLGAIPVMLAGSDDQRRELIAGIVRGAHARLLATHDRGAGARDRAGGLRRRGALRDRARAVRQADRALRRPAVPARRHGDGDRGRPPARVPGREPGGRARPAHDVL